MNKSKIIDKLELDLAHFLIGEMCKKNPMLRSSPEMYKYKGLNITYDPKSRAKEKTISVRIGALEAEFMVNSGEKNSGGLAPQEEKLIVIWIGQSENNYLLQSLFTKGKINKTVPIIPFDLEEYYAN